MRDAHFAELVRGAPWAITPEAFRPIVELLEARERGHRFTRDEVEARIEAVGGRKPQASTTKVGAIAVVPISGVIVPRATLFTEISGGTSLEQFSRMLSDAVGDPGVDAIVLDVNSPGGAVAMVTETAARIRAARGRKPIVAVANTMAASAALHLASQATELVSTPSGMVGSIGVLWEHVDTTKADELEGVAREYVTAGRFKADGWKTLTDTHRAHMQEIVDDLYATMTNDIARGRGIPVAKVRGESFGEGRVLTASAALSAGMIDAIETIDDAIARARDLAAKGITTRRGATAELEHGLLPVAEARELLELEDVPATEDDLELAAVRALRADMSDRMKAAPALATIRALAEDMRREESGA